MKRQHHWSIVLTVGVLLACTGYAAAGTGEYPAVDHQLAPDLLYVCNQDAATVSIIDMSTNEIVETVDLTTLGLPPNAKPHHVQVEPDGAHWYLSLIGAHQVLKFDRSNRIVGRAEFEVPGMLALDATHDRLYVGRSMSAVNPPHRIGIISTDDMSIDEIDVFFPRPHALTVSRDGAFVYSASLAENRVVSIEVASEELELIDLDGPVHTLVQFAISPDGRASAQSKSLQNSVRTSISD